MDASGESAPGETPWDGSRDYPKCRDCVLYGNDLGGGGIYVGDSVHSSETLPAEDTRLEAQSGSVTYGNHTGTTVHGSTSETRYTPVETTSAECGIYGSI